MNRFSAAVAFETAVVAGAAAERRPSPLGTTLHHPGLPDAYMVNQLVADPLAAAAAGADGVERLLDDVYADSRHRRVWIPDALAGQALRPDFVDAGFAAEEDVVLALADSPPEPCGPAREVDRDTVRAIERAVLSEERTPRWVVDQLLAMHDGFAAAATARYVAAEDASHATVYARDGVAKVEDVGTRPAERRRGLARSTVALATQLARDDGAELVLMIADAGDWPAAFYRRLGYADAGRWWSFTRSG